MAQKQAFKSSTPDWEENEWKLKIDPIESILCTYSEEERKNLRTESDNKFISLKIKTGSEENKKTLQDLYFQNFIRKVGKKCTP